MPTQPEYTGTKQFSQIAPDGTATLVVATNRNRTTLIIQNVGTVDVYLGGDDSVTTLTGLLLPASGTLNDEDSGDAWYAITEGDTADLRVLEVS